jgi:hypothetical protein
MGKKRDLFADVCRRIEEELGPSVGTGVASLLRREFAGERVYICSREFAEKKTQWVARGFAAGMTVRQISDTYGMPVSTVFWHARRHPRRR